MEKTFSEKHCYLVSILLGVLCSFPLALGSSISQITRCSENLAYTISAAAVIISALVGMLIMKESRFTLEEYGICKPKKDSTLKVRFYIPLIFMQVIAVGIGGFKINRSLIVYGVLLLFTFGLGLNEEVYFRGLVLKFISEKGIRKAVLISSLIFGLFHFVNVLRGQGIRYTVLQVCFAFLFGLVFAEIATITKSLWGVIVFHMIQDFVSINTFSYIDAKNMIIYAIQAAILAVYAVVLWRKLFKRKEGRLLSWKLGIMKKISM